MIRKRREGNMVEYDMDNTADADDVGFQSTLPSYFGAVGLVFVVVFYIIFASILQSRGGS